MKKYCCCIGLFFFINGEIFSQQGNDETFNLDSLPGQGVSLDKNWKFYAGDMPGYAAYKYDGKDGVQASPSLLLDQLPIVRQSGIGWFRLQLQVDSSLANKTIGMTISLFGAAEIFLNNEKLYSFGNVSSDYKKEITQAVYARALNLKLGAEQHQILAVRYSFHPDNFYIKGIVFPPCTRLVLYHSVENIDKYALTVKQVYFSMGTTLITLAAAALITLLFYFSFRVRKEYLYFGLFFLCQFLAIFIQADLLAAGKPMPPTVNEVNFIGMLAYVLLLSGSMLYINGMYAMLKAARTNYYRFMAVYAAVSLCLAFLLPSWGGMTIILFFPLQGIEILLLYYRAGLKHFRGAWVLFISIFVSLFLQLLLIKGIAENDSVLVPKIISIVLLTPALGLLIFLAIDFARTSSSLRARVVEVEELSNKTLAQEKEKQEILAVQKDKLETEVAERTAELRRSLSDLKSAQSQLIQSEKMASLGELTAGIAHEIQNPLNFVNNFSEVNTELIEELKGERQKAEGVRNADLEDELIGDIEQNMEKIAHHGKRADAIVKGMLQHTQKSSGQKVPTDINKLADEYLRLAYHGLRAKDKTFNATLKTDYDETIGNINIVLQDIGRVLLNLFNNAFYAVKEKSGFQNLTSLYEPAVSVSTKKEGGKVLIYVKDNGGGIPQNIVDKIFQPFFTTKPTGQGTGLGLSLAYDIVKAHGGELKVNTKENEGTTFIIELPAV